MELLGIILTILCGGVALVWLGRHREIRRARENPQLWARDAAALAPAEPGGPMVSMLLAAKDEATNIGPCVRSLLEQDYAPVEVIVIDDRSADGTGELARQAGGGDPRLRVLKVRELPAGWAGKSHAMWQGIAVSRGQWICMTDADCRFTSPATVRLAVDYARRENVDMLSVLPNLEMRGFWENVVQPVCSAILIFWLNPRKVNDPHRPEAYANGAFMLMRRDAYDAIGGHEAIKGRLMEDLALAGRIKQSGRRLRVAQGHGLVRMRMYTSLRGTLAGWSRIFYGSFGTPRRLGVSLGVLLVMGLLPYAAALTGWLAWPLGGGDAWLAAAIAGSAAVAAQISVIYRFYRLAGARAELCWTYGLGCAMAVVALLRALAKCRRGTKVHWRGTAYPAGLPGVARRAKRGRGPAA